MSQTRDRPVEAEIAADRAEETTEIRVLYVEDDPGFTDLTVTCLEDEGEQFEITTATDAATGLERLGDDIDCIVSDYNMREMNGIEFLETVRETHPDLPFILFTGRGSEEVASEAISAGVTDYLQKEGGTDQFAILANRIANAVDQDRTRKKLARQNKRLKAVLSNAPVILFTFDAQGVFKLSRGRGLAPLDCEPNELIGESVFDVFESYPDIVAAAEAALDGERGTVTQQIGDAVFEAAYQPLTEADGTVESVIGVAYDITERTERERELEAERRRFRSLFEQLSQSAVELEYEDGEPIVERVNQAFEDTFGHAADEITGESLDAQIVPEDRQAAADAINDHVQQTGRLDPTEVTRRTSDGCRDFLLQNAVYDDGEKAFAIYTDITERRDRQREREILRKAVDKAHTPVTLTDPRREGNPIVYVNDAFEAMTGYSRSEVIGRNCRFLQGDRTDPEQVAKLRDAIADEKPATVTLRNYRKDGTMFWNRVTLRPIYDSDGELVRYYGSQEDVTERKEHRERLERQNNRLSEFAGVVAHDLRSPLTVAENRLELATSEFESEHLDAARDALARSDSLITDLLTLARDGVRVRETAPVNLAAVTASCWEVVDTAEATLDIGTDCSISADYARLQQVIENLFRNAIVHGGDDVRVTVGSLADQTGFYIADDGEGVPSAERDQIFESGYSTRADGTGFGLAIVRAIVHDHGWDIAVTESDAGGARFEISGVER